MQKDCAHCGKTFVCQRTTRKYCSDNCKQMAYFERNGFVPAAHSVSMANELKFDTVKDVKYDAKGGSEYHNSTQFSTDKDGGTKVLECFKCLIGNLVQMSDCPGVDRETFIAVSTAFSQLVRFLFFRSLPKRFPYRWLILELEQKMRALAETHRRSDVIRFQLSPERKALLVEIELEMAHIKDIKFEYATNF